jgi:hypothetical protein
VIFNHLLAEPLQLGVGGPLETDLAEVQLRQTAAGGRRRKQFIADRAAACNPLRALERLRSRSRLCPCLHLGPGRCGK